MTYTPPEGVTIGSFTTNTLPASFRAPAGAAVTYKIYGTTEGAGEETENLWRLESAWSNSVGDSRNFFNATLTYQNGATVVEATALPIYANGRYSITLNATDTNYDQIRFKHSGAIRDINIGSIAVNFSEQDTYTITFDVLGYDASVINGIKLVNIMLTKGSTAPTSYIPYGYKLPLTVESGEQSQDIPIYIGSTKLGAEEYVDYAEQKIYKMSEGTLVPTDPPILLPAITASGETTITTTETLGNIELTGDWTAIMGSTEAESIDIEFTVDAEEYIAFATIDDGPSIQVSDTITMPSSADSFTLDAVAWGREQYTDTVYNALS